jgi:NTP pyrophosphatase (non-canonical NTP hydrolase)
MTLQELINSYYAFKKMRMPDATDAHLFFVSEVGELADAIVSQKPGWTRNNPDKHRDIPDEIGDCLQMLTVYALQMGLDPIECMKAKWASKGWTDKSR